MEDALIITAGCVLFAVHMAKVTHDLLAPEWRKRVGEAFAKLFQLLRSRLGTRDAADEVTEEVAARLLAWQLGGFQNALKVLLPPCMLFVTVLLCKVVFGVYRLHTAAQDGLLFGGYAVLLLADWCPRIVNKRSLDFWYSILMCGLALYMIPPLSNRNHLLEPVLITKLLGALLSLGRMKFTVVLFWNMVHVACGLWSHAALGQAPGMNLWVWPLVLSFLTGKIEVHLESELRKDVEANVMQDRQSACDALSAMFYDVVVELDHNLCISAHAPKLAAFLLRSTPVPLERTPFEDLLEDDGDRARLRELLRPAAGHPPASSFVELAHARMRGGYGAVFQVELFGYRFRGPVGRQRYLVGIREAGDLERGGMPMVHAEPQPVDMSPLSPFDQNVAVIDPYRRDFPILSHTPFFSIRIMPVAEGTCLMPAVVKGAAFESWVQTAVNWHRRFGPDDQDCDRPEHGVRPAESFVVTFKPRSRNTPMCTRALCRLKIANGTSSSSGESSDSEVRVELSFSRLVQVPRCLERSHGGGSSSSSGSGGGTPPSPLRVSLGIQQSNQPTVYGVRTSL